MNSSSQFKGTIRSIYAHWPTYFSIYCGIILALITIGISAQRGWFAFIPLALALFILLSFYLLASLWSAHNLYSQGDETPHHTLFDMGNIQATDTFVYIDLGIRHRPLELGRRLTTGQIIVIDIYSPQWTTSRALVRWRKKKPSPTKDPRFEWYSGDISLLPLPDRSVKYVILCQVLSELWQPGDQKLLLKEIHRILVPNGRLLMAERARTQLNWLVMGPRAIHLLPVEQWRKLLSVAGFRLINDRDLHGIIRCFRVEKPTPSEAQQLALELEF